MLEEYGMVRKKDDRAMSRRPESLADEGFNIYIIR